MSEASETKQGGGLVVAGLTGEPVVAVANDPLPRAEERVIGHGEDRVSPLHEPGQTQHGRDPATTTERGDSGGLGHLGHLGDGARGRNRTPGEGVRVLRQEGAALANLRLVGDRSGCC